MFDLEQRKLRHLPFFEEIASYEESDAAWRAATAGLVVLRLVDSWIQDGARVTAADAWALRSVRNAIEEVDSGSKLRTILFGVVDSIETSRMVDLGLVAPKLMAYGQFLEYDAKWSLAGDVYETLIVHTHPTQEADVATQAHLRLGYCLRQLGGLTESVRAYRTAGEIARCRDDLEGVLRARIGEAKAAIARGNMPEAGAILDETIGTAGEHRLSEIESMARHDRAMIAHLTGDYELAVRFAYEALETSQSPRERDRILGDIATSFYQLGVRTAARDAYLILAATAQEQYARWYATLNLMEIAADDGDEMLFEQYRRSLQSKHLPARLQVQYWMEAGIGYDRLQETDQAVAFLKRAVALAEEHGLNQYAFEAAKALELCGRRSPSGPGISTFELSDETVRQVAESIHSRRQEIGV